MSNHKSQPAVCVDDLEFTKEELQHLTTAGLVRSKTYYTLFSPKRAEFLDSDTDETGLFTDNYHALHLSQEDAQKLKDDHVAEVQKELDGYNHDDPDYAQEIAECREELEERKAWIVHKFTVTVVIQPVTTGAAVLDDAYDSVEKR